jgi:hypothetical protein
VADPAFCFLRVLVEQQPGLALKLEGQLEASIHAPGLSAEQALRLAAQLKTGLLDCLGVELSVGVGHDLDAARRACCGEEQPLPGGVEEAKGAEGDVMSWDDDGGAVGATPAAEASQQAMGDLTGASVEVVGVRAAAGEEGEEVQVALWTCAHCRACFFSHPDLLSHLASAHRRRSGQLLATRGPSSTPHLPPMSPVRPLELPGSPMKGGEDREPGAAGQAVGDAAAPRFFVRVRSDRLTELMAALHREEDVEAYLEQLGVDRPALRLWGSRGEEAMDVDEPGRGGDVVGVIEHQVGREDKGTTGLEGHEGDSRRYHGDGEVGDGTRLLIRRRKRTGGDGASDGPKTG